MAKEDDDKAGVLKELIQKARSAFWSVAKDGFSQLIEEAPAAWGGPEARFYRAEKKIITEHLEPFYWGAFVTIFLFGTFRVSGSRWYARFRETSNFHTGRNNHKLATGNTPSTSSNLQQQQQQKLPEWKSYLDQRADKEKHMRDEALRLPTDLLVSLMCGFSSIIWLSKPSQMKKDLAEAPLVSGKSVVSEFLCHDMEAAFNRHVDPKILTKDIMKQDDTLVTFLTFVKNCRLRSDYIRAREKDGSRRPDVIPYPGLDGVRRYP